MYIKARESESRIQVLSLKVTVKCIYEIVDLDHLRKFNLHFAVSMSLMLFDLIETKEVLAMKTRVS